MKFIFLFFAVILSAKGANAINVLKDVDIGSANQVRLVFDSPLSKEDIRLDAFQQIIQLSIESASVYPAKIKSLKGDWSKLFVYQYSPTLVRVRLTVEGDAVEKQKGFSYQIQGKTLMMKMAPISAVAAGSEEKVIPVTDLSKGDSEKALPRLSEKESSIIARLAGTADKKVEKNAKKSGESSNRNQKIGEPITGNPPLMSWKRSLMMLFFVLSLFLAGAFLVKKLNFQRMPSGFARSSNKAVKGNLFSLFSKNPKRSQAPTWIKPLATHVLGPGQSISVVKVGGKTLVLGVTSDSIKLISQVDGEESEGSEELSDAFMEQIQEKSGVPFEKVIDDAVGFQADRKSMEEAKESAKEKLVAAVSETYARRPQVQNRPQAPQTANSPSPVRARIHEKLGNLKALS